MTMTDPNAFPLQPPKSTERRLEHFDLPFKADVTTFLYKFLDALTGDAGAGVLLKENLLTRFSVALETIYFSDLDYIFGGMNFLERADAESYPYNPVNDMLNSDQWDEVNVKDAWYRARIRDFFEAATLGGTPNGIRAAVQAGTSTNCEIFEVWRYQDSYGLTQDLGRAPVTTRSEFVVKPHKSPLPPRQLRLLKQMVNRIAPVDTVVTIDTEGLQVNSPVGIQSASADSSYFEVQKRVTPTPLLQEIPAPELLAIDLRPTEDWLFSKSPEIAPYTAFNITQEYGYYYLASGGSRSPIDSVQYTTSLDGGESFSSERNYESVITTGGFTAWQEYELADSPDNFPGGKFGVTPSKAPARTSTGSPYNFPYSSQEEYVEWKMNDIILRGGQADWTRFRTPLSESSMDRVTYTPDLAVAYSTPAKDSTVTTRWTREDTRRIVSTILNPVQNGVNINAGIIL